MSDPIKSTSPTGKPAGQGLGAASSGGGGGGGWGGPRGPRTGGRGPRRPRDGDGDGHGQNEFTEKVVYINRSAKVVKGGRRFSFSALVVVGDRKGRVGVGLGKSTEVADAIRKGGEIAKGRMVTVSMRQSTIPHAALARFCGAQVLLRPASPGTGIIAGKTVRAVLESVGIRDILTKSLGSQNASNVVKATFAALQQLQTREEIYRSRGIAVKAPPVAATPSAATPPAPPAS